jgi:hypothetical protein
MKTKKLLRFICLVYFDGRKLQAMTEAERKAFDASSYAYDVSLQKQGNYVIAEALQSQRSARTVTVREGKVAAADGPFRTAKEPLGGFILIQAKSMAAAEKIAAGIPLAKWGAIEVRPVFDFS